MTDEDLDAVLEIEGASYASPWTREHFLFELHRNRHARNHVVRAGDRLVAYACAWHLFEELKINNIAVHPGFRRRGLAGWLLAWLLDDGAAQGCRVACLEVRRSNVPAITLYERHGFRRIGVRKGYYERDGEDAFVLEAPLPPA